MERRTFIKGATVATIGSAMLTQSASADNHIEVSNEQEFLDIQNDLTEDYILVDDIELTEPLDSPLDIMGEGGDTDGFRGTLDGDGYTVDGLEVVEGDEHAALFHEAEGAVIENISFINTYIESTVRAGVIVGALARDPSTIENVTVQGELVGVADNNAVVGGIVGEIYSNGGDLISGCQSIIDITVDGSEVYAGGILGMFNAGATIEDSRAIVDITAHTAGTVGGLCASPFGLGDVKRCSAHGNITFDSATETWAAVGGIAAQWDSGSEPIVNSYSTVSIQSNTDTTTGSLVGEDSESTYQQSFAIGEVTGGDPMGGFMGEVDGEVANVNATDSYWDLDRTGSDTANGGGDDPSGIDGLGEGDFKDSELDGFDFTDTWRVGESYPQLQHEPHQLTVTIVDGDDPIEGVVIHSNYQEFITDENGEASIEVPLGGSDLELSGEVDEQTINFDPEEDDSTIDLSGDDSEDDNGEDGDDEDTTDGEDEDTNGGGSPSTFTSLPIVGDVTQMQMIAMGGGILVAGGGVAYYVTQSGEVMYIN